MLAFGGCRPLSDSADLGVHLDAASRNNKAQEGDCPDVEDQKVVQVDKNKAVQHVQEDAIGKSLEHSQVLVGTARYLYEGWIMQAASKP